MATKIKIKRGLAEDLPTLDDGELAFTTDDGKLHIGNDENNVAFLNSTQVVQSINDYAKIISGTTFEGLVASPSVSNSGHYTISDDTSATYPKGNLYLLTSAGVVTTIIDLYGTWLEPTLLNSLTTTFFKYKKIGNKVIVQGDLTNTNATGFQTAFAFPSGYRPNVNLWFPCSVDGAAVGTTNARVIAADGNFQIYMAQNSKAYISLFYETI